MALVREKQLRALELAQAGKTYDEIADELGYANRSSAWRLVRNGLDRAVGDHAEKYLQLSLDRLEALVRTYWPAAIEEHDASAAHLLLKALQAEARLLGLDRPTAHTESGTNTKPWGIVMTDEERSLWEAAGRPSSWVPPRL
jgi:hypothetical protein